MARPLLLASVLLVPVLAGCVSPTGEAPVDAALSAGPAVALLPAAVTFETCGEQLGVFPFPMAAARALAPEGFTVEPFDPTGQTAVLFYVSIRCDGASVDGVPAGDVSEGFLGIAVAPPEDLRHPEEGVIHGLLVGHVTTSEAAQAAYQAWGVTSSVGAVDFARTDTPVLRMGTTGMSGETGSGAMRVVTQQAGGEEDGVARLFSVEGDAVTGGYDMAWVEAEGAQGEAFFEAGAVAGQRVPALPGFGYLYWKEGDRYTKTPLALAALAQE